MKSNSYLRVTDEEALNDDITFLIRINLTESKCHVYYQNGILAKRYSFLNERRKYGDPVASSYDGRYLVFRKSDPHLRFYN